MYTNIAPKNGEGFYAWAANGPFEIINSMGTSVFNEEAAGPGVQYIKSNSDGFCFVLNPLNAITNGGRYFCLKQILLEPPFPKNRYVISTNSNGEIIAIHPFVSNKEIQSSNLIGDLEKTYFGIITRESFKNKGETLPPGLYIFEL